MNKHDRAQSEYTGPEIGVSPGGSKRSNPMPSNRYSPLLLANHKYPSFVCVIAVILGGAPLLASQDL